MTPTTVRKLAVEVVDARDLIPKDGQGTSSPYVVIDYAGQRKRTRSCPRDCNPHWQERLEFIVPDPPSMDADELLVEVYHDGRLSVPARKNHFLGRVRIYGTQFPRRGHDALVYYPLEKRALLSWIHGEIGLRIYYYDEIPEEKKPESTDPPPADANPAPAVGEPKDPPPPEVVTPTETAVETQSPPPVSVTVVEEVPTQPEKSPLPPNPVPEEPPEMYPPEVRKMQTSSFTERVRVPRRHSDVDCGPRGLSGRFAPSCEPVERVQATYDLVEPMQYLFVRVFKARGLLACESPYVKIQSGPHLMRTNPAREVNGRPEWNQVFALSQPKPESTLEISVCDGGQGDAFLGGVCFDLSDVPIREQPDGPLAPQWEQPDGPLAPQWYRLEGGDDRHPGPQVTGDIMLSVWFGTQADESFPEACTSDAPSISHTRSKVYQSPKLWYLRVSVIEAQDLRFTPPPPGIPLDIRVKIQLGFQSSRTRKSTPNSNSLSFAWLEDLMFVASDPLDDHLIVLVEDRSIKEPALLGHVTVPVGSVERRMDERQPVATKWFNLDGGNGDPTYSGRLHLRLCLEGGYHVLDEAAHVCSDFRPTAKQLWKPPVGILELGIIGARGLLPMKTKGGTKGSTDAYCVAKYGKKWVRTRTIMDSFDPRWNEQYTWQVYDPCTVLTVGVFDNWRMFADVADDKPDYRIGKVRIRISTLESNRVYTRPFPLLVLLKSGVKKMGDIHLAVRFMCPGVLLDTWAVYTQPMLPRMHYLRPIGVSQQEALRGAAIKMVATWLTRSEPVLGPEVVRYMLDADAHTWSIRRCKANWFRIMGVIAWTIGLCRWINDIRRWRNPITTVLVHVLYLVLVWYPELVAPTATLYVCLIGTWYYRFKPNGPAGMDMRLSQAEGVDWDELDEEFDTVPSGRDEKVVRARYERLRTLGARVQTVMGDLAAQGERVQALVSWRDPRATKLFVVVCMVVSLVLYVAPPKMVAVALGFYFLRHPMFRDPMPPASVNFFRRLPSLSDRLL
ncbi:putative C2 domain, phosphoribosyltransferase, C2 domain superfamily [Dioscorea sansibarensis]